MVARLYKGNWAIFTKGSDTCCQEMLVIILNTSSGHSILQSTFSCHFCMLVHCPGGSPTSSNPKETAVYEDYFQFPAWLSDSFLLSSAKDTKTLYSAFCREGWVPLSTSACLYSQPRGLLPWNSESQQGKDWTYLSGQGQPRAIDWTVKSGGRSALLVPRQPINANSLLIHAAAGPLLKWKCCPAEQWFLGYNWLNAWLGRLVLLNDITSAAFQPHQE